MDNKKKRFAHRTDETTFDRIYQSFMSDEAEARLTEHEKEVRDRYLAISAIADKGFPDHVVVKIHIKKTGVSRATAYRDLKDAQEILGEVNETTRRAKRYAVEQLAKRGLRLAEKGSKTATAYASLIRALVQLHGLDRDDTTAPDPEQFLPPAFILQVNTEGKSVNIDLGKLSGITDVEYEEVAKAVTSRELTAQSMEKYLDELEQERK